MEKPRMNTMLDIDNIFGENESKVMPFILTVLLGAIPLFLWLMIFQGVMPLWVALVATGLLTARLGLKFIGKEDEKMKAYIARRNNAYLESKDLIQVTDIVDGLIMYMSGTVAYIVHGYIKGYLNDDKLSVELERFMNSLDMTQWDMHLYNTDDEVQCTSDLHKLKAYKNRDAILERMHFYSYQDKWAAENTELYQIVFLVKGNKTNWKTLRNRLEDLVQSDVAKCFNELKIANTEEVIEILSRDQEFYVDINQLLEERFRDEGQSDSSIVMYDGKFIGE